MKAIYKKINEKNRNDIVLCVFGFNLIITFVLVIFIFLNDLDFKDLLLRDDGYYMLAKKFANGEFNSGSVMGPGLPLIYAPIHFFNESLHPFIRLLVSQVAVLIILFIVSKLTIQYLNNKQLLCGLFMVILNPVFIQWSFRTSVDLYLSLFLGLFILYLFKYINSGKIIHIFFSFLAYSYAIFTRQSFILIPVVLLITSLFVLRSKRLIIISFTLFLISGVSFIATGLYLQNNIGSAKLNADFGRSTTIITNLIMTETILETGQFHKGTVDYYNIKEQLQGDHNINKGVDYIYFKLNKFYEDFEMHYPGGNTIQMIFYYIKIHTDVFIAKVLLGPIFFFALSSRELVSYLLLIITVVNSLLIWLTLKSYLVIEENKQFFFILFAILFGYFLLHWMTHAYSRYSLTILPYLFIWTGPQVVNILNKFSDRF
ncbi:MAG: glycosyltransferase family 39 protein [Bacteroidales bacterium]|nr:glycosyltransferase family 39 protein [Bacteroidales bacterium]